MFDNVGVGVYSEFFARYASMGSFRKNFNGELEAIRVAIEEISVRIAQLRNIAIFSDSLSAIAAHNVAG